MTELAVTAQTLLRVRRAHLAISRSRKKREVRPTHSLIESFYEQVARDQVHPIVDVTEHDGFSCVTARYHFNHGWARYRPADSQLTLDFPPRLAEEAIPADQTPPTYDWEAMTDRQILTTEASWPKWPKLWVIREGFIGRGGEPFGWIVAGDKPRGGTLRVTKPGSDQDLAYKDVTALLKMGWRVDRTRRT